MKMKLFGKPFMATALALGVVTSAHAAIQNPFGVGPGEMFLSVYDATRGVTFTKDTGITTDQIALPGFSVNVAFDQTAGSNWSKFATGMDAANTVWTFAGGDSRGATSGVVSQIKFASALNSNTLASSLSTLTFPQISSINSALSVHENAVNGDTGLGQTDVAANLTTFVSDIQVGALGQHSAGTWGPNIGFKAPVGLEPESKFTDTAAFVYYGLDSATFTPFRVDLGKLQLTTSGLQSVSAVPLPAALWLFGSAIAGLFSMNRRKV